MDKLFLTYIHDRSPDYRGDYTYQFIFSDKIDGIDGEEWDSYPAGGNPGPPFKNLIKQVGDVSSGINLTLAQHNEQFSMWDAMDKVLPLGWQNIDGLDAYPDERLVFHFGMPIKQVSDLLYANDMNIKFEKQHKND
jgi:hypothetical protein